ncbi:MAG: UDP-N-acetylmuramyl-tripeptide synthetase, partial [Pseudomonadota bacterium]
PYDRLLVAVVNTDSKGCTITAQNFHLNIVAAILESFAYAPHRAFVIGIAVVIGINHYEKWPGLEFAVVNLDDPYALQILAAVPEGVRKYGFTCKEEGEHEGVDVVTARNIQHGHQGLTFNIDYRGDAASVASPLFGDFNVENLAATLTVLLAAGFSLSDAGRRLGAVRAVPGRMERFTCGRQSPTVIVDYAHTPDALERVLKSLRAHCQADLWLVFGCGGDRDRGKRALMGHIAEQWADRVVITDDNPRSEDGNAIVQEILEGCRSLDVNVIRDRAHAIRTVIGRARPNDIVVVAGKGHETTQEIQGIKHPFSDRVVVRETLLAATEGSGGRRA